ncbi:MAG: 2Fe-2S iron-sulfur cluster-binding protein [Proteobacteria bacterium]|nr:2Fe-2S iron-sulfur cluster-binding protein [Pseudomonadota bacterium]MDA1022409.1 2Fe-2S iron-sulfur cluster-binding protein [Pseudomonadota bacterium]
MPKVTFIEPDGRRREADVVTGVTLQEIAEDYNIDLEGACEGSMACSTCHVIVADEWFDRLDPASEEERDMLDLAFDLRRTSRLGCQITMTDALDGLIVSLPSEHRNMMD